MIDATTELLPSAAAGAGLAILYLAALRASVRRIARADRAGVGLIAGAFARIALVCGGIWLAGGGDGPGMLAALAGFVLVRSVALGLVRRSGPATASGASPGGERAS
jgi:F1F0 ATPase subunit 2